MEDGHDCHGLAVSPLSCADRASIMILQSLDAESMVDRCEEYGRP